jgi:hypothetical protein
MKKFVLIVESEEARSGYNDSVVTRNGDKFLVTLEPEGWVEATSEAWSGSPYSKRAFPNSVKVFNSEEDAVKFAKRWKGHPWWCVPNGNYKVIEVIPRFRPVHDGYTTAYEQPKNSESVTCSDEMLMVLM